MREKCLWIFLVMISLFLTEAAQGEAQDAKDLSPADVEEHQEEDERGERIFAYYTSTSITRLATTTITAISTCLSTSAGAAACTGRKRRSSLDALTNLSEFENTEQDLQPSINNVDSEERSPNERSGRKLTIWSTAFTTVTITSTSALAGTTVTASLLCAIPGVFASCYLG